MADALPLCRNATLIFAVDITHDGRTEKDGVIFSAAVIIGY